jgi:hypothetical protein
MLLLSLALAATAQTTTEPISLTETHQRDIGCVALIAILAGEQERGVASARSFGDVRQAGKDWMPIVGERVVRETGQPREVIGVAMTEAAKAENYRVAEGRTAAEVAARVKQCTDLMYIDLGKAVLDGASTAPLPKPVKSQ